MFINLKKKIKKNKYILFILTRIVVKYNNSWIKLKFFSGSNKDIFFNIYKKNLWGSTHSISGPGSNLEQTKTIRKDIPSILYKYKIKSILDIPCGDFYWMKELDLKNINYIGADIVKEIIDKNNKEFRKININFKILDLTADNLPSCDLIFCRDCLVHFSFKDIFLSLNNIKKTNANYFLTTNFVERIHNKNIATGSWRTLNLCKAPFYFPKPLLTITEKCTQGNNKYRDKSLSLYEVKSIPDFPI